MIQQEGNTETQMCHFYAIPLPPQMASVLGFTGPNQSQEPGTLSALFFHVGGWSPSTWTIFWHFPQAHE